MQSLYEYDSHLSFMSPFSSAPSPLPSFLCHGVTERRLSRISRYRWTPAAQRTLDTGACTRTEAGLFFLSVSFFASEATSTGITAIHRCTPSATRPWWSTGLVEETAKRQMRCSGRLSLFLAVPETKRLVHAVKRRYNRSLLYILGETFSELYQERSLVSLGDSRSSRYFPQKKKGLRRSLRTP